MQIDILTIFPEMFDSVVKTSLFGKAIDNGLIKVVISDIRSFSDNKHKKVDDYPYGGGHGMVMSPQPLFDALKSVLDSSITDYRKVIYLTPRGKTLTQQMARELARYSHLILICGHYEAIDQRVIDTFVDTEISIGDYVLTGGEIPAMVLMDAVSRLIPGVLGNINSTEEESFSRGLLEYPHYTRPQIYENLKVPDVLLSGNHRDIDLYRMKESIKVTIERRPDLLDSATLTSQELAILDEIKKIKTTE